MRVTNKTKNTSLITQGRLADNFWLRLRGLLGAKPLKSGEGLILAGEKSIHTFFMGFSIDVVYVNKQHQVIRTTLDMVPYKLGPFVKESAYILELPVGAIGQSQTEVGDQLEFVF